MKETTKEILRRIETVKERRRVRQLRLLSCFTVMLLGGLTTAISLLSSDSKTEAGYSVMGAFLLGPETGGYILVALIAFLAGILLTVLALKYRKLKAAKKKYTK